VTASKCVVLAGVLFGLTGVIFGAWGAHGLAEYIGREDVGAWDTAVSYQWMHAITLLIIGIWHRSYHSNLLLVGAGLMSVGIVLFSGSLYLLVLSSQAWLGPITPLGGIAFILGWTSLAVAVIKWR